MAITNFKLARFLLGESQLQVAARAGIHVSVLSQLENGWRNPTPDQIQKLERALPNLQEVSGLKVQNG